MKRFPRTPALAVLAFAAAAAARAQDAPAPRGAWGHGMHPMATEKCLTSLDLPAEVRTGIDNALANGHAALKTDGLAMRTANDKMKADLANGAEKSVLGQDAIDLDAARQKMKTDAHALHDQVFAQLSPDQQEAMRSCTASHAGKGRGNGSGSNTPVNPES
jgi:hypothetical protein